MLLTNFPDPTLDLSRVVIGGLAVLLGLAGFAKLRRPGPSSVMLRAAGVPAAPLVARVTAVAEIAVLVGALVLPGRLAGSVVAVAFGCLDGRRRGRRTDGPGTGPAGASATRARPWGLATSRPTSRPHSQRPVPRSSPRAACPRLASHRPGLALVDLLLAGLLAVVLRQWLRGSASGGWTPRR